MKLLFPLDLFFPSRIGGPANTIYWLCKALVSRGHKVTVVTTKKGIDDDQIALDQWIESDGINARYCSTTAKYPISVIRYSLSKLNGIDIIVFSSICFLPNFIISLIASLKGKRIIWSPRGELFDSAVQGSKSKKLFFLLIRFFLEKKILFHATSLTEQEAIIKYFPHARIVVIPNYMELPKQEIVETSYSDFIYVGRIAPIKALDKLIAGLGESSLFRTSEMRMKIVGGVESQFEDYYRKLLNLVKEMNLQDKVTFVGSIIGKEKFRTYASARYSFLVSTSENFGNVVIESLSQGTPVVASKGTPWEKLPKVGAGFWIDNTPDEIGKTIDTIIEQSHEDYLKQRENALQYSKEFDVYSHIGEWEAIINQ